MIRKFFQVYLQGNSDGFLLCETSVGGFRFLFELMLTFNALKTKLYEEVAVRIFQELPWVCFERWLSEWVSGGGDFFTESFGLELAFKRSGHGKHESV